MKDMMNRCLEHMEKRVVGQKDLIKKLFIALVSGGHVLVEGVPGVAKTLIVSTIAQLVGLPFKRIQFTPDLLPSDLIGMSVFRPDEGKFVVEKGPVFTNVVLADEINRAPPKVQSAMLEVMAEKQVTIFGETFSVSMPYFVMATQNPIEHEGTYSLPEAELDRFMFKLIVDYPNREEEHKIATSSMVQIMPPPLEPCLSLDELKSIQERLEKVHVDEKVVEYAVSLVLATRDPSILKEHDLEGMIQWGASPRATLWLIRGAKAAALASDRDFITPHDVKAIAKDVLRHRLVLSYEAQASGISADTFLDRLLLEIPSL